MAAPSNLCESVAGPDFEWNVVSVVLVGNQAPQFDDLSSLTHLQELVLSKSNVTDLRPLKHLRALRSLDLSETAVSSLDGIEGLTSLECLMLDGTQVVDLTPLSHLTSLQFLYLDGTPTADAGPLSRLTKLQVLSLAGTQITELSPLSEMHDLKNLDLSRTEVSDLSPLARIHGLTSVVLEGTAVKDVTPLSGHESLSQLILWRSKVPWKNAANLVRRSRSPHLRIGHYSVARPPQVPQSIELTTTHEGVTTTFVSRSSGDDEAEEPDETFDRLMTEARRDQFAMAVRDLVPLLNADHQKRLNVERLLRPEEWWDDAARLQKVCDEFQSVADEFARDKQLCSREFIFAWILVSGHRVLD